MVRFPHERVASRLWVLLGLCLLPGFIQVACAHATEADGSVESVGSGAASGSSTIATGAGLSSAASWSSAASSSSSSSANSGASSSASSSSAGAGGMGGAGQASSSTTASSSSAGVGGMGGAGQASSSASASASSSSASASSSSTSASSSSAGAGGMGGVGPGNSANSGNPNNAAASSSSSSGQGGAGGGGPTGIILTGSTPTTVQGGMSGTLYQDMCPTGQVIIGLAGSLTYPFGPHNNMHALCGTLNLTGNGPYSITVTGETPLPSHGGIGFAPWSSKCPANQMVVGFTGRANSDLQYIAIRCAELLVTGSPGSYSISIGIVSAQGGNGNPLGGSTFPQTDCPAGQVGTGSVIRASNNVHGFGLICSTPELTY